MVLFRFGSALVVLAGGFSLVANAQTEKTFPTETEINLVLTQTERAIQQYKPLIELEAVQMGRSGVDAVAHDRQVVSGLELAIKAFRGKPQGFNGPLGFAFFEWLDDADRNAALCAGGLSNQAMSEMLLAIKIKRTPCFVLPTAAPMCPRCFTR